MGKILIIIELGLQTFPGLASLMINDVAHPVGKVILTLINPGGGLSGPIMSFFIIFHYTKKSKQ